MKQRENSAAGMVVGMAAGAALGAAGAMMATQSKRQMRRNVRKVMKGAENAVMQLDKMAADFVEKHRPEWNGAFYRASYFAQIHIRAVVLISPSRLRSIWMLQVTVRALFTSLPVSTEAGRFLMVRMPLPFSISPVRVPV